MQTPETRMLTHAMNFQVYSKSNVARELQKFFVERIYDPTGLGKFEALHIQPAHKTF